MLPREAKPLIGTGLQPGVEMNGRPAVSTASRASDKTVETVRNSAVVPITRLKPGANEKCQEWLLWQLADSAFPTGGFGHSSGLEAAYQHREVTNRTELMAFLEASLTQLPHGALPFVKSAHEGEMEFSEIDSLCDAFTSNHVTNRASRGQGQALLASAERSFGGEALKVLRTRVLDQELPGHLAPVFGAVMAALEVNLASTVRLFVFVQLRGMIGAAVRLNIVGPLEAQSIQHGLSARAEEIGQEPENLTLDGIAQTAPLLDLFQGTQDRLYSRLFQS